MFNVETMNEKNHGNPQTANNHYGRRNTHETLRQRPCSSSSDDGYNRVTTFSLLLTNYTQIQCTTLTQLLYIYDIMNCPRCIYMAPLYGLLMQPLIGYDRVGFIRSGSVLAFILTNWCPVSGFMCITAGGTSFPNTYQVFIAFIFKPSSYSM